MKVNVSFFGLYLWELFQTCDFEWSLVTRRRKFQWPLIFFFLCRYCLLWSLIGVIVSFSVRTPINCSALYTFNSVVGHLAILGASTALMIRTWNLWQRNLAVVIPLSVLAIVHWALLWRGMFLFNSTWEPATAACVVTAADARFLQVTFFYTMGFNFILLCVGGFKMFWDSNDRGLNTWNLLFKDGLIFFVVAFAANILPAVFNILNLNPIMNVISAVPAGTLSAVAACRTVIQLQDPNESDAYTHQAAVIGGMNPISSRHGQHQSVFTPEVRVKTEQIVMNDFSPSAGGPYESRRSLESGKSSRLDPVKGTAL